MGTRTGGKEMKRESVVDTDSVVTAYCEVPRISLDNNPKPSFFSNERASPCANHKFPRIYCIIKLSAVASFPAVKTNESPSLPTRCT